MGDCIDWSLTLLGTEIARAIDTEEAFGILDESGEDRLTSWTSGGCLILSDALSKLLNADQWTIFVGDTPHHAVVRYDGAFFDADGAFDVVGIQAKFAATEGVDLEDVELIMGRFDDGLREDPEATRRVVLLLEECGIGPLNHW